MNGCINILCLYHLHFSRNSPPNKITVGPVRFIVLKYSASPKMVIQNYFKFFQFFSQVLELFECRRGDPYMNVNNNFGHFSLS